MAAGRGRGEPRRQVCDARRDLPAQLYAALQRFAVQTWTLTLLFINVIIFSKHYTFVFFYVVRLHNLWSIEKLSYFFVYFKFSTEIMQKFIRYASFYFITYAFNEI